MTSLTSLVRLLLTSTWPVVAIGLLPPSLYAGSPFRHSCRPLQTVQSINVPTHDDTCQSETRPVISFPGGGIFFWWQAGAIMALQERYDLSNIEMVGASAGALAACLAACDADMNRAMDLALDLCDENEVWERPLGLAGVWGGMVRDWLNDLLPHDAHSICRERVNLVMLPLWPPGRRKAVSDFSSKADLIDACMASVHIPYFMNRRFSARFRGLRYVDGSFRASREDLSLGPQRPTVYVDHSEDEVMSKQSGKFLSLTNRDGLLYMQDRGYGHVQKMFVEGQLTCLASVLLDKKKM